VTPRAQRSPFRLTRLSKRQKATSAPPTQIKLLRTPIRPPPIQTKQPQTESRQPQRRIRPPVIKSPPGEPINEFVTWAASTANTRHTSGRSSHTLVCEPEQDATSLPTSALRRHQRAIVQPRCASFTSQREQRRQQSHPGHREQRNKLSARLAIVKGRRPIAPQQPPTVPGRRLIAPEPARNVPSLRVIAPWRHTIVPKRPSTAKRLRSTS
jgi:hypothetical protein